jgi:tRNA U34 5-methylaminomethyl-2-thiouridine-forming methyltransferase MnmC
LGKSNNYKVIDTADGSYSIIQLENNITFHSTRGAVQESQHIFIQSGLNFFIEAYPSISSLKIFEVGFGTGLNAFLTAIMAGEQKLAIEYCAIDAYPLPEEIYKNLNYSHLLGHDKLYENMMHAGWNQSRDITPFFKLEKIEMPLEMYQFDNKFDIVYFDAFAPNDQQELWTSEIFKKIYDSLSHEGVLVTYSSKSAVRKTFQQVGFVVEKLKGPPGKREIIRATKMK